MLNPSTADALEDDPTIRRCMGFAEREGASGIEVVNLFSYRATKPGDMMSAQAWGADITTPENDLAILDTALRCEHVICAWGHLPFVEMRWRVIDVMNLLQSQGGVYLWCLGKTKAGEPRHPLYLKNTQPLLSL